jgi:hypothetical protein
MVVGKCIADLSSNYLYHAEQAALNVFDRQ